MNLHVLIDKNHPNRSKTIKNRKNHPGEFPEFFSIFLAKFHFSRIFQLFGTAPWRHFRDFARSAMHSTIITLCTENLPKSETLMPVEKINLARKKSPKIGNFIFHFCKSQSVPGKILDTLRVPVSRTRAPVRIFGPKNAHLTAHVPLGAWLGSTAFRVVSLSEKLNSRV